jgi:hypothetical protein
MGTRRQVAPGVRGGARARDRQGNSPDWQGIAIGKYNIQFWKRAGAVTVGSLAPDGLHPLSEAIEYPVLEARGRRGRWLFGAGRPPSAGSSLPR